MNKPIIPLRNVMPVFPKPFKTLLNVVFRYKNGQIHAKTVIKSPAIVLENRNSPNKFPKSKKKKKQQIPNIMQKVKDF